MENLLRNTSHLDIPEIYDCLEDGRVTKYYFMKMRLIEICIGMFNIFAIFFSILHSDFSYFNPNETLYNTSLLVLILVFTIFTIFLTVLRYAIKLKLEKARREISKRDDLITSQSYIYIFIEVLVYLLFPNPFFQRKYCTMRVYADDSYVSYEVNHLFAIFIMFRVVILCRIALYYTIFLTPRAYRLCKVYGCTYGYLYALKCLFKTMPIKLLVLSLSLSIIIFSYILRISERPILHTHENFKNLKMDFNEFSNALWCVVVSMSTIGYGDFYPVTIIGRAVITLIGFWGIFVISILVVSVSDILEMDVAENKALNLLIRLEQRTYLKREAAHILTSVYKYKKMKKNGKLTEKTHQAFISKLRRHINSFKKISRKIQSTYDLSNIYEIMGSYFDNLKDELKSLRITQELMLTQMGIEPIKDENFTEEKDKKINLIPNPSLEITAKKRYLSEDLEREYDVDLLDSNKRFLQNDENSSRK